MSSSPTPAATVLIAREKENTGEPEFLLLQRNSSSTFMPSYYVFPGGSIDRSDTQAVPPDSELNKGNEATDELFPDHYGNSLHTYKFAAIRETFEECGLLLASHEDGPPTRATVSSLLEKRSSILTGEIIFADMLRQYRLFPDIEKITYLTSFTTPSFSPIRFEARFFFAPSPPSQEIFIDGGEIVDFTWETPRDALAKSDSGSLALAVPTRQVIRGFSSFPDFSSILEAINKRNIHF